MPSGLRGDTQDFVERRETRPHFRNTVVQQCGTTGDATDVFRRPPIIYGGDDLLGDWQKLENAQPATEPRVTAEVASSAFVHRTRSDLEPLAHWTGELVRLLALGAEHTDETLRRDE